MSDPTLPEIPMPRIRLTGGPQGFDTKLEIFDAQGQLCDLPASAISFQGACESGRSMTSVTITLHNVEVDIDVYASLNVLKKD